MSGACSLSTRRVYGKARVCRVWSVARSTHYARDAAQHRQAGETRRRGRPAVVPDEQLTAAIREILAEAEVLGWVGEGYRKVCARLRWRGISTSRERVRRLMRDSGLLAPHRQGHPQGPAAHDGSISPAAANRMWGTDATQVTTRLEGTATVFVAVDHFVGDLVGVHAARPGTRFEALEPIHQGIREHYGALAPAIADGLTLRHDNAPQYISDYFQQEMVFLGMEPSSSFLRAPRGNGIAERFICTLKEQLLWIRHFDTVEELPASDATTRAGCCSVIAIAPHNRCATTRRPWRSQPEFCADKCPGIRDVTRSHFKV